MRISLLFSLLLICCSTIAQNENIVRKKSGKYIYTADGKWWWHTRFDSIRNFSENRAPVMKNGKWGYIDDKGKLIAQPLYTAVLDFNGGLAGAKNEARDSWIILNEEGLQISTRKYDTVIYLDSFALGGIATYFQKKDTVYTIYHHANLRNQPRDVDSIIRHGNLYLLVYGYSQLRGNWKPTCQVIDSRANSLTPLFTPVDSALIKPVVITDPERYVKAVLNTYGELSSWHEEISEETNGFRITRNWKSYGVLNSELKNIIPTAHSAIRYTGEQFLVTDTNSTALYDTTGNILTGAYSTFDFIGSGIYRAKQWKDTVFTLYNSKGTELPGRYHSVNNFRNGLACIVSPDTTQYAYIDTTGHLISKWYPCATDFHEVGGGKNYAAYKNSFHGGSYTSSGSEHQNAGHTIFRIFMGIATVGASEIILAPKSGSGNGEVTKVEPMTEEEYNKCYFGYYTHFYGTDFHDGYSVYTVTRNTRISNIYGERNVYCGLLDSTGKEVTQAEYLSISPLDTFFIIQKSTGYGIMTRSGKVILQPLYGKITSVRGAYFKVEQGPMYWFNCALFYYDGTKGKFLTAFRYSEILDGGDSAFILKQYGDYGYVDVNGKFFIPMKYETAEPFKDGEARVRLGRESDYFYIDRKGKKVK